MPRTVLVVDDEPQVCSFVASVLREEGFSVLTARSGSEALAIAQTRPGAVDILLSDVIMPDMDGAALANELRKTVPGLPVILMTGGCDSAIIRSARHALFLAKPFGLTDLVKTVAGTVHVP